MTNQQILALLLPPPAPSGLPVMQAFQLDPYGPFTQEWVTYNQAREFAIYWDQKVPNIHILAGDDEQTADAGAFGIFKPFAVQTYFPESKTGPDGVVYHWLAARFLDVQKKEVHAGLNVGLMVAQFYRYPYSSWLVISDLIGQIMSMPATPYQGA